MDTNQGERHQITPQQAKTFLTASTLRLSVSANRMYPTTAEGKGGRVLRLFRRPAPTETPQISSDQLVRAAEITDEAILIDDMAANFNLKPSDRIKHLKHCARVAYLVNPELAGVCVDRINELIESLPPETSVQLAQVSLQELVRMPSRA